MKYIFNLCKPKSDNETLILLYCYFNDEKNWFVYSTQKTILPIYWDSKHKKPNRVGKLVARDQAQISKKLRQFEDEFFLVKSRSE